MRLLLDEEPCKIEATSIGDAIAGAAAIAERQGRVIIEVTVDGDVWDEQRLASPEFCAGDAGEVRLTSANLGDLVCQTLNEASGALTDADSLQRNAAELLQADQNPEAMAKLADALDIWLTVQEAVLKCAQAMGLSLDTVKVGDGTVQAAVDRLNVKLRELRDALQTGNLVGVSDTLLYELPDVVAQWRQMLDAIRERVQEEQDA